MHTTPTRWRRALTGAALLSATWALGGCESDPVTSDDAITVALSADRSTATPAAPVQLTITLTNRSTETLTVPAEQSYGCPQAYVVQDVAGRTIDLPSRYCTLALFAPTTLAPGAQMVLRESWTGETRDAAGSTVRVAPGVYRVRASVAPRGRVLQSEAVTVVVP